MVWLIGWFVCSYSLFLVSDFVIHKSYDFLFEAAAFPLSFKALDLFKNFKLRVLNSNLDKSSSFFNKLNTIKDYYYLKMLDNDNIASF